MLIIIIIVQQMKATANENQKGISGTIQMCLCFFFRYNYLARKLKLQVKMESHVKDKTVDIQETVQKHRGIIHDLMSAQAVTL